MIEPGGVNEFRVLTCELRSPCLILSPDVSTDPCPSLAQLPRGHRFAPVGFHLSAADVRRYVEAVEDANRTYFDNDGRLAWAPPLAAAAFALKAVMDQASLPAGSLHTGQDLEFRRPIAADSDLTAHASVVQRSEMRGMAVSVIEFEVRLSGQEDVVLVGRSTVMAPLSQEGSGG